MGLSISSLITACLALIHARACAYTVRRPVTSTVKAVLPFLQPQTNGRNLRFVQTKSRLDLMVFITNVFFPSQDPPEYKKIFKRGGCPRWLLDPRQGSLHFTNDWLPAPGWSYDVPNQTIVYTGSEEAKEPPHSFPFNLFLPRRTSTRFALMKRDFFCQGTQVQSTIMLDGAKEAGLIFRGVGERNFWAALITLGAGINLIRVKNGERQNLGTIGNFMVQGRPRISMGCLHPHYSYLTGGKWYTVNAQEHIGDVRVTASEVGMELSLG